MPGPALQQVALGGGLTIVGVVLGQVVQVAATRRRDGQQAQLAREERLATWRLEVYRDLLVRLEPISVFDEEDALTEWAKLEPDLLARLELAASAEVRDAVRLYRVAVMDRHGERPSFALNERVRKAAESLREACRNDLQRGGAP